MKTNGLLLILKQYSRKIIYCHWRIQISIYLDEQYIILVV